MHCFNSGFMLLRSSNNKFSLTSRTFRKILTVCGRPVFCNSVIRVLLPFSLNQFLDFMGLLLGHLSLMIQHWLSCSISFSTFVPNLGNVLFFLILCYPLFDHKGKQNLLSGKDFFFVFVSQWHLVISHIFHDQFVMWSSIISYIYHFLFAPPAFACTYPIFSTYFPLVLCSNPIMSSLYSFLG